VRAALPEPPPAKPGRKLEQAAAPAGKGQERRKGSRRRHRARRSTGAKSQ
jgi:hypothetical protein